MLNKIFPALVVVAGAGIGFSSEAATSNEAPLTPQDAGAQAPELAPSAGVGAPLSTSNVKSKLGQIVTSRGWVQGPDPKRGRYLVIGVGVVMAPVGSDSYIGSRRLGWMSAMQDARLKFIGYLESTVSSSVVSLYTEPDVQEQIVSQKAAVEAAANPSATDKLSMLIHSKVDAQLRDEGLEMNTDGGRGRAMEIAKQLLTSDSVKLAVKVAASSEAAGLQVVETYEATQPGEGNKTKIGIIAIYSSKSRQMSESLLGKAQPPTGKAKMTIADWVASFTPDQLLYTQGVQQRTNEHGEVCLIAFGQAAPRTSSERSILAASTKAYANAFQDIRDFTGTKVASNINNTQSETVEEYSDKSQAYTNSSAFSARIESIGKSLKLSGVSSVRSWDAFHPLEKGRPVVGEVLMWNASSAAAAKELRTVLEANGGSFGGEGYQALPGSEGGAGGASGTPTAGDDGSGVSGDDDDI